MARLLGWLYPPRCQGCGRLSAVALCAACESRLAPFDLPRCAHCGLFVDALAKLGERCADCRPVARDPLVFARSAAPYGGLVRALVHRLKYRRRRAAAGALGEVLGLWLAHDAEADERLDFTACSGLVPVPLHRGRRFWRGFNQAELLAGELSTRTGTPVAPLLRRTRATRPQVGLNPAQRRRNVAGAFEVAEEVVRGGYYVLVDDVYTTGATLRECARVLRRAGATRVAALTVACRVNRDLLERLRMNPPPRRETGGL